MISNWMARGDTKEASAPRLGDPAFDWSGFVETERTARQSDTSDAGAAVRGLLQRFAEALKASGLSV